MGTCAGRTVKSDGFIVLLVLWGSLFKTESVGLIEVSVLAECCSSLVTAQAQRNDIVYVFLWHFTVKTPTKGTRILGRAALHLGVNFHRMLSFPINYRMFDSKFCHQFLWDLFGCFLEIPPCPGCAVLSTVYSQEKQVAFPQTLNT